MVVVTAYLIKETGHPPPAAGRFFCIIRWIVNQIESMNKLEEVKG